MGIRSAVWKVVRPFFNVPKWMGWDIIKDQTDSVVTIFFSLFRVDKAKRVETFEEAKERLQLTEAYIEKKRLFCFYISLLYALIAVSFLLYSAYLFEYYSLYGAFVSFLLFVLSSIFAFKENFWWFQMTKRKLGCRFSEWFNYTILGREE